MQKSLESFIPSAAIKGVESLIDREDLLIKIKKQRKTKHGDYRKLPNGKHQITVNNNLNQYRFLITLIHEIAHFEAFNLYGHKIKPHGKEWKSTFQKLMLPYINPEVFPMHILPIVANHFKNPKASSNSDAALYLALKQFDAPNDNHFIFEVPEGAYFIAMNGKVYQRGKKRRKRFECIEKSNGKLWLFNPNAEVEILKNVNLQSVESA